MDSTNDLPGEDLTEDRVWTFPVEPPIVIHDLISCDFGQMDGSPVVSLRTDIEPVAITFTANHWFAAALTVFGRNNQAELCSPTSPDAMSMRFDLKRTEICWKDVDGHECGITADPESETGLCSNHRNEIKAMHAQK